MRKKGKRKTKKSKPQPLIRTDVWRLVVSHSQKEMMLMTLIFYRKYLLPLVLIVNTQWSNLANLSSKEQVNAVEKMIHLTASNPNPKHSYYQKIVSKYPCHRKFPSYLRRAAIADAIGIVSSFQTRYRSWQSGNRFRRTAKPPRLTAMCQNYPALYKGQQILYGDNYQTVALKLWSGKDGIWADNIEVKNKGNNRHLGSGNKLKSPSLVVNKNKCQLSMPVQIKPVKRRDTDYVCSVELGINNAATAAIVGRDGTVKARTFINPARDIDYRNKLDMMIAKKAKQTSNLTGQKLPKGFCRRLNRKSGRQDHADLNASYNIGARYWYCLIVGDKNFSRVYDSKSSDGTLRTPIVQIGKRHT
ncbi:MAG: hypothetical protein F6K10_41920, partial [Moorea sp. SIO2B7]|nr:hypothetical protein [Moorena sp. SIO2B7]